MTVQLMLKFSTSRPIHRNLLHGISYVTLISTLDFMGREIFLNQPTIQVYALKPYSLFLL